MKSSAHTPKQILLGKHHSTDYLSASIYKHTHLILQAQEHIQRCTHPLLKFCTIAFYNQTRILFHTQSNLVISKFKFEQPYLLVELKKISFFSKIKEINIKLFFEEIQDNITPATHQKKYLSNKNTQKFIKLKDTSHNEKLNASLQKFIQKHGNY